MEEVARPAPLVGGEIHGFNTSADLDIGKLTEEASTRWLRPNEVHAILSNYTCFRIQPQPVDTPSSGTLLLFDRKMLRNFRKDGHNWRKKKDGKTVQEAHEKLKIGNEERIHVYYARNEDDPNFYRRCYWLLDRDLERIVLVHYRQTSEENASQLSPTPKESGGAIKVIEAPVTPLYSISGSDHSEVSGSVVVSEEINSLDNGDFSTGTHISASNRTADHSSTKLSIDALDMLGWDEIMEQPAGFDMSTTNGKSTLNNSERWNGCTSSSPCSVEDPQVQGLLPNQGQVFSIIDISPSWAYMMQETKIILVGKYADSHTHLEGHNNVFCILDDICVPVESLKNGVYRIMIMPEKCGTHHLFLTIDGYTPISQVINFECKAVSEIPLTGVAAPRDDSGLHNDDNFRFLTRLFYLLFSPTKTIAALSARTSPNLMREAKKFSSQTSSTLEKDWMHLLHSNEHISSISSINHQLLEITLKNKVQEWILLNIVEDCKIIPRDAEGQGVIHLCAILDYAWAINLFALSNISLDVRDASGWTALHWAAYYGRERTVAALLSAGANPSLVTDPTHDFPGGCTASDLASQQGYEGLGAYLAEKGLQAHFQAMKLTGNISSPTPLSVDTITFDAIESENISEQELCLKDSLAAYRNAADAADRIQAAFRERSHKQQMKAAQLEQHHEDAEGIIAALKIQQAFRNYNRRKMMKAAARIQGIFRTWQARRNFINMRRQVIKIQAVFRGHQIRKQYHKICWSVGVLEKAVLRWRLKRRGLRGLQAESSVTVATVEEENCVEEDFYRVSREQAEDRVKRSVVRVQAMFRSYRAQQQYRRMKLAHGQAKLEYNDLTTNRQDFRQW